MKYKTHLILLIVVLVSYSFLTCSELGTGVQAQTLPTLYRLMDSDYLINDWYVNQTDQFNIRYYYNHLILNINSLINNLELTVLLLHIISFVLFHIFLFYLILTLFKDKRKSLFIILVIFIGYPISLGATSFFKGNLSPNGIAWALIMLSFYLYFRKKYLFSFLVVGISLLFDFADALPVAGLLLGNLVLSKPFLSKEKIITYFKILPFFIISLGIVIPLYLVNKTTPYLSKLSAKIVVFSHAGHALPSTWGILDILPFVLLFILFLFIFKQTETKKFLSRANQNKPLKTRNVFLNLNIIKKEYKQTIKNFILIILIYCIIGILFVEFYPQSIISKLFIFRTTKIITLLGYIIIGSYFFTRITNSHNCLEKIFFVLFPLSFLYPLLVIPSVPILLSIMLWEKKKDSNIFDYLIKKRASLLLFSIISLIVGIFFIKFLFNIIPVERTTLTAVLPHIILPAVLYIFTGYILLKTKKKIAIVATIIVLVLTLSIGPFHPYFHTQNEFNEVVSLCDYIKINSQKDSLFLTPLNLLNFRTCTTRAIVINVYYPITDLGIVKWYLRVKEISNNYVNKTSYLQNKSLFNTGYISLTEKDLARLKEKYKFDYVVFEKPKFLDLNIFYENKEYIVYQI